MRGRRRRAKSFYKIPKSKALAACICLISLLTTLMLIVSLSETSTTTTSSAGIGKLGGSIIEMLPSSDLAFTLFLPTEEALKRDLGLNDSSAEEPSTHAVLTRVLGFCAVPKWIWSGDLRRRTEKEAAFESIGGFGLHVRRDARGRIVVNGVVRSEVVDLKVGSVVVHLMDRVLMDAEFEESVRPDDDEDN